MRLLKHICLYRAFIGLIAVLLTPCSAYAIGHIPFKRFTSADGIPNSIIFTVFEDSRGLLWVGTDGGVGVYDGYKFRVLKTASIYSDNAVLGILEDHNGRIWFRTTHGMLMYYENGELKTCTVNKQIAAEFSNVSEVCVSMYVDTKNNVWMSFSRSQFILKVTANSNWSSFEKIVIPNQQKSGAYTFQVEAGYESWLSGISTASDTIHLLDQYTGYPFTKKVNLLSKTLHSYTHSRFKILFADADEYFVAANNIVYRISYSGQIDSLVLSGEIVLCGTENNGWLYFGVLNGGCFRLKKADFNKKNAELIFSGNVTGIEIDREGGCWISTYNDGLYYIPWLNTLVIDKSDGLVSSNVTYINKINHQFFYGYPQNTFSVVTDQKIVNYPWRLFSLNKLNQDSFILAGSKSGVILFNNENEFIGIDTFLRDNKHLRMPVVCVLPQNRTARSQSKWVEFEHFANREKIIQSPYYVSEIAIDKKGTLLATTSGGIYSLKNDKFVNVDSLNELMQTAFSCIHILPDNSYWIGSRGVGIVAYNENKIARKFDMSDGLLSNDVRCIIPSARGNIWIGTSGGLQLLNDKFEILLTISSALGLPQNEVNHVFEDSTSVYVATSGGVFRFEQTQIYSQDIIPELYFESFQINDSNYQIGANDVLRLNYWQSKLKISYIGISLRRQGNLNYRYRILPGAPWQQTNSTMLDFPKLIPGEYCFELQVQGLTGKWSKSLIQKFIISPPFWQLIWFRILTMILIIVSLALIFLILRKRQLVKQEKQLAFTRQLEQLRLQALQAQMNPHFMFNVMGSIQHFILNNDADNAANYLTRFSRLLRNVLEQSSHERISFDQEIETLRLYLQLESLRMERFSFEINCDEKLTPMSILIPPMIIQPYIENAIWHGLTHKKGERKLRLNFRVCDGEQLIVEVEDNGIGRKAAAEIKAQNQLNNHRSRGMELIEQRIGAIHYLYAQFISVDTKDLYQNDGTASGTLVTLIIQKK
ncbi:MAG: sensor histidine kinase [Bacteroidia bacterium]